MKESSLSFQQIKAQVAAVRRKVPNAKTIGLRSKNKWSGPPQHEVAGEVYQVYQCDSPLAMRIALQQADEIKTTVLITDLDEQQVSDDILVRLKPRKLIPLDSWQIVKSLFQVRAIDPRITCYSWMADALMETNPVGGYPSIASGFLDAETAWTGILEHFFGLTGNEIDLLTILKWSIHGSNVERFRNTPKPIQEAAIHWLSSISGPATGYVLSCVAMADSSASATDALPLGLACGVIFHDAAKSKLERAIGKMEERFFGGKTPDSSALEKWSAAATEVVRLQIDEPRQKHSILQRADVILRDVNAEPFAILSDTLPSGFDLRLAEFGKVLQNSLLNNALGDDALSKSRELILNHDRQGRERRRIERIDMAIRLVRWLDDSANTDEHKSLAEAAQTHLKNGGYIDWARLSLRSGDPVRELSEAYAQLFEKVTAERERESRRFGELLVDWTAAKSTDNFLVPVEQILERVVAKLATQKPVLVVVVDGMSVAVFRELMSDILGQDWSLIAEDEVGLRPGLATVPSVTEVSRTSLLTGRLAQGNASTEKLGFAEHPALLHVSRSGYPPILFHKGLLQETDDASLAADIRKEISSSHRKVVGVVVNAVDDHLAKGEQIDTRWTRDEIRVLPVLLHEAKAAGRIVIMVADHGHILDCNAKGKQFEGGERWRYSNMQLPQTKANGKPVQAEQPNDGGPEGGELRIAGQRVVIPDSHALIAPWSEKIRYGVKKNGYHGGISPQEMVVPIGVLTASSDFPTGWSDAPVDVPTWWEIHSQSPIADDGPNPNLKPVEPKPLPEGMLFPLDELEPVKDDPRASKSPTPESEGTIPTPAWIQSLLASPVFEEQKRLGGRTVPQEKVITDLLKAIDARNGKITMAALARALQLAPLRMPGFLSTCQRLLNVDGYDVLSRDDASETVQLDKALLLKQFDLVH
jgi:PglZ domain